MSHFLDRLTFFNRIDGTFANGHGITTHEDRRWEDGYRKRWQHDKIVRSTHGVNCTGSCSWKIYVKGGIVTWETQQTDYPRTRPDLPNHEPRGCARGASYSWYLYSANRVKYPLVRSRLLKLWREEGLTIVFVTHSVYESTFLSTRIVVLTPRPGRLAGEIRMESSHQRTQEWRTSPEFAALAREVSLALRIGRHVD